MQSAVRNIKTYSRLFKPKNCKIECGQYNDSTINIEHQGKQRTFSFVQVFQPDCSQAEIFDTVALPIVERCLEGENGSIIAYGYTGTGKTHTIEGSWDHTKSFTEGAGLARRCISTIFQKLAGVSGVEIRLSYVEIWMEQIFDTMLLNVKNKDKSNFQRVNVERLDSTLNKPICQAEENAHILYTNACLNRTVKSTSHNMRSSRSHGVFTIYIKRKAPGSSSSSDSSSLVVESKLNLVDLAGAERLSDSEGVTAEEAKKINLSLIALGKVIDDLSERKSFVNYRDSQLTQLLRDSLGGNSNTALIATLNVDMSRKDAALRTCEFAARVSGIKLTVTRNYGTVLTKAAMDELQVQLAKLKAENERLKKEISQLKSNPNAVGNQSTDTNSRENSARAITSIVETLPTQPAQKTPVKLVVQQSVNEELPPPPPPPEDELPIDEFEQPTQGFSLLDRIEANRAILKQTSRASGKNATKIQVLEDMIEETRDGIEEISWQIDVLHRQIWDADRQLYALQQRKTTRQLSNASDDIVISAMQDRERSILNGQNKDCTVM